MLSLVRNWVMMPVFAAGATAVAVVTGTPSGPRDGIGDIIKRTDGGTQVVQAQVTPLHAARQFLPPRCRAGSSRAGAAGQPGTPTPTSEQAQRLMKAIDALLAGRSQEPRRSAQAADRKRLPRAADLDGDARRSRAPDPRPARLRPRHRHRRARRRVAEEDREPAQEHPRSSRTASSGCARSNSLRPRTACCRATSPTRSTVSARTSTTPEAHRAQPGEIGKTKTEVQEALKKSGISCRRSRSTCCSTACFRATWSASSPCSTPPS